MLCDIICNFIYIDKKRHQNKNIEENWTLYGGKIEFKRENYGKRIQNNYIHFD